MAGNGYGGAWMTRQQAMDAYDAAPPLLRRAMQGAVSPFSAQHLLRHLKDGHSMQAIIRAMREADVEQTHRAYGPRHPEADPKHRRLHPGPNAAWSRGKK